MSEPMIGYPVVGCLAFLRDIAETTCYSRFNRHFIRVVSVYYPRAGMCPGGS